MSNSGASGFGNTMGRYRIDEKQRIREVVKNGIKEDGKSLNEIKEIVALEIGTCRDSPNTIERVVRPLNLGSIIPSFDTIPRVFNDLFNSVLKHVSKKNVSERETVLFSSIDHAYIDKKYKKYCLEFWLQEANSFSNAMIEKQCQYADMIHGILLSLRGVQNFHQIPEPFRILKFYKVLMKNYGLIKQADEKNCLIKFKKHFLDQVMSRNSCIEKELNFVQVFVNFLLAFKSIQEINNKLQLENFCSGDLPFDQFLEKIENLEINVHVAELTALQKAVKCLNRAIEPFALEEFKQVISAYLEEVKIDKILSDDRLVIEVKGKSIAISQILDQLETAVRNKVDETELHLIGAVRDHVEEVRIVGADMLHIDANFENEVWHGKNIVIFAQKIKIHNTVTWDVSGKNNDHKYNKDAGTGEDNHGRPGAPGFSAESGGNVFILADEVESQENFTIISHGGNGSCGQDGGGGSNGKDGKGITKADFEEKFPSPVKLWPLWSTETDLLTKTMENIRSSVNKDCSYWSADSNHFIEGKTHEKNDITFSFCPTSKSTLNQAFILYRGSLGQLGGRGGEGGLGGEGGYNGEITTSYSNIILKANKGENGNKGKDGQFGKPGKNGWDMGYTDYKTWPKTEFHGTDQKRKLRLEYTDDNYSDRIWCPYKDQYASIKSAKIEYRSEITYEERKNSRQNDEQQRQTQATKKKTISQSKISSNYTHLFNSIGRSMLNSLKSNLVIDNQLTLQMMAEASEQHEKVATQVSVKRVTTKSTRRDKSMCHNINNKAKFGGVSMKTSQQRFEDLNTEWKQDLLPDKQLRLENAELNLPQLQELFLGFETTKRSFFENESSSCTENHVSYAIERILNTKYRLAVFHEIAKKLPVAHEDITVPPKLLPEIAAKHLVVAGQKDDISHEVIGRLSQCLYENDSRQLGKISRYLKKESKKKKPNEAFKRSVATFILGAGKSEHMHPNVRKYYKEYEEYFEKLERSLQIFLEPFLTEIQRYKHILALWFKSANNQSIKYELMKEIRERKFLHALWNRVDKQLQEVCNEWNWMEMNWNQCYKDQHVFEEFDRQIQKQGPSSEGYREFLAHIFDINIRLYTKDQDNRLHFLDDHKPSSKKVIHILQCDNEFIQLDIDENSYKLEKERENRGDLFMQIFTQTKSLKEKKELDYYLQKEIFLSKSVIVENAYSFAEELDMIDIDLERYIPSSQLQSLQMIECLQKISPQYIGHKGILYYILMRFCNDGIHVSFQELSCLVNSILTSFVEDKNELNIFCWIVAAYPQKNWIDEIVLLELENHFKRPLPEKYKWRESFFKVENKNILLLLKLKLDQNTISSSPISIEFIGNVLHLLSHIPTEELDLQLQELDVSEWPYILQEKYWTHKLTQLVNWDVNQQLSRTAYHLLCIENTFGTNLAKKFVEILETKIDLSPDLLTEILNNFYSEKWILSDDELKLLSDHNIIHWMERMQQTFIVDENDRNIMQLVKLIKGNANTSEEIITKLPKLETALKIISQRACKKTVHPDLENLDAVQDSMNDMSKQEDPTNLDAVQNSMNDISKQEDLTNVDAVQDAMNLISKQEDPTNLDAVKDSMNVVSKQEGPTNLDAVQNSMNDISKQEDPTNLDAVQDAMNFISKQEDPTNLDAVEDTMNVVRKQEDSTNLDAVQDAMNFISKQEDPTNLDAVEDTMNVVRKQEDSTNLDAVQDAMNFISKQEDPTNLDAVEDTMNVVRKQEDSTNLDAVQDAMNFISKQEDPTNLDAVEDSMNVVRKQEDSTNLDAVQDSINFISKQEDPTNLDAVHDSMNVVNKQEDSTNLDAVQDSMNDISEQEDPTNLDAAQNSMNVISKQEDLKSMIVNNFEKYGDARFSTDRCDTSEISQCTEQARIELLVDIDRVIELNRGFKLRDTQKLAVLALLTNERNTLAQVSTGEGKSLIVVAASIIMVALHKQKVDIITSSSVLAKRDAESNRDIYTVFGINVSHNCNEDIEKRKDAYSGSQIVYGDLSNFQRDYLLDRFYGKNILGDRNFENVIVDEVDSMLLDKGNNMLYLSHDLPGLDKLESIYIYIWQWVTRPAGPHEDVFSAFNIKAIKKGVLNNLYGLITTEDVRKLGSELNEQQVKVIWECMIEAKLLDNQGQMREENVAENKYEITLPCELSVYKDRIHYLIRERLNREKCIQVPNYLKPFIEQHLESWINSAVKAVVMKEGHDYIMDVDRTGTSPDLNPNVTILDRDTGTDQANSQWDEALHQFLQLKHGCKLSLQSLKAVFISNVSYLKRYKNLYGLTGTLGSKRERELLTEVHRVDFVTIPTARTKQFNEKQPLLLTNRNEWREEIVAEAIFFTDVMKRSVLIICETIDDANTLHINFPEHIRPNIHIYTRDHDEFDIAEGTKELEQGQIIIATNLSGRGTDIKITEELRQAGGLHVILTYLPNNSRIEQQAFGRAARSGDKGSGRLMIIAPKTLKSESFKILDLKSQRDREELHRISDIKAHYETQIITEEDCFREFEGQHAFLKKLLTNKGVCTEAREILLQSCLDRAAIQMIKLGKHFCKKKEYNIAIELFDKVIALEPRFSEAAHYYKAFALIKKTGWQKKPSDKQAVHELKTELRDAARLFEEHFNFSMSAAGIISTTKQNNKKSVIQIDTYVEQQESKCDLYSMFSQSINNIFGQFLTPKSFTNEDISEELSEGIFEDLLRTDIIKKPQLKKRISEDTLNEISYNYGIPSGDLAALLSTFKSKELNEKEFRNKLKRGIKLASRKDFWKLLIQNEILTREVNCVVINVERLRRVHPRLLQLLLDKIKTKKLKKQSLKCTDEILFCEEHVEAGKTSIILEKYAFKTAFAIDKKMYERLKNKGVFSVNKKACIDITKISSASLLRYDSITLEDFDEENIAQCDAERILSWLVEQRVLKQDDSETGIYRLRIPSIETEQIQLPQYPVYQNAVRALLSVRFIYRKTLEDIEEKVKARIFPIYPRLIRSNPHHELIQELFDQRIIKPFKVTLENDKLEKKLCYIYSRTITRNDLELMLSQHGLSSTETFTDHLCKELVEKDWFLAEQQASSSDTRPSSGISASTDTTPLINRNSYQYPKYLVDIEAPFREIDSKYFINNPDGRKPLNLGNNVDERNMKLILDNRLLLAKEDTINHIVKTLKRSRSLFKTLKVPDSNLKPLADCVGQGGFKHIEEVNILTLNGLGHVLNLEEKKWSRTMLLSTGIVIALGVCQITIGAVLGSHVENGIDLAFFREGLGDIFHAVDALKSGYFSWQDYALHKCQSVLLTAFNFAVSFITATFRSSWFGSKVTKPQSQAGKKMTANSGNQIIKSAGKSVAKEAGRCIALKFALNGVAFGLSHTGCDAIVKHQLQTLCDRISNIILCSVGNSVEAYEYLFPILEETYRTLGKDRARKFIDDFTQKYNIPPDFIENLLDIAKPISRSVIQEISRATATMSQAKNNTDTPPDQMADTIFAEVSRAEDLVPTADLMRIVVNCLHNYVEKIKVELSQYMLEQISEQNTLDQNEEDSESFKKAVVDEWKSLLLNKAQQAIDQNIVCPIIDEGVDHIVRYHKKMIKRGYRSYYRGGRDNEYFEGLKQRYDEQQQTVYTLRSDDLTEVEYYAKNEYHKILLKLLRKTRNHKLFATIVRGNIPMDVTCLDVCIRIVTKMLEIGGLTVIVNGQGSIRQKFSFSAKGVGEPHIIELELINNNFLLHGSGITVNKKHDQAINKFFYESLSDQLRKCYTDMTREDFRAKIASHIEEDPDVINYIKHDWNKASAIHSGSNRRQQIISDTSNRSERWRDIITENAILFQDSIADYTGNVNVKVAQDVSNSFGIDCRKLTPGKGTDQFSADFSAMYKNISSEDPMIRRARSGISKRLDGLVSQLNLNAIMKNKSHNKVVDALPRGRSSSRRPRSLERFPSTTRQSEQN